MSSHRRRFYVHIGKYSDINEALLGVGLTFLYKLCYNPNSQQEVIIL